MKLYHVSLALFAGLGLVAGQGMDSLPPCARDCATGSIPKTCKAIDVNCICSDKSFITGISCCVASTCSAEDQTSALNFAQQICGGAGVTDLPQSASCTSGNTASATLQTTGTTADASATTTATGAANGTRLDSSSSASAANATKTGSNTQSVKTQGATATDKNAASNATASSAAGIILGDSSAGLAAILGAAFYALLL